MSLLDDIRDVAARIREHDAAGAVLRDERKRLVGEALPAEGPSYRKVEVAEAADLSRSGLEHLLAGAEPGPREVRGSVTRREGEGRPAPAKAAKPKPRPKRERLAGMPGHQPNCKCGACVAARAA